MTTPPEFTPTPEQVEEVASAMLDSALGSAGAWQLVMDFTKREYRKLAEWHIAELHRETEGSQSRLAAINHENLLKTCRIADDSLKIHDLNSQLDALKAQVVVKDEAVQRFLDEFGDGFCECKNEHSPLMDGKSVCDYCFGRQALAQLSPK